MKSRIALFFFTVAVACSNGCNRNSVDSRVVHREGEPDVISVDSDDAEMNAAIAQARQTTGAFLQVLAAPKPNQSDFSAKRPYPTSSDRASQEHIWIPHLTYDGKLLHGKVGDEPLNIPNLKFDQPVTFPPGELSDWMYLEDGKIVGGYTIRVLRKHMSEEEAAEFDRHLQFKE
jgi:uncharacterized protein YegJ (DUF2314 family)